MTQEDWANFLNDTNVIVRLSPKIYGKGKLSAWEKTPNVVDVRGQKGDYTWWSISPVALSFCYLYSENVRHTTIWI